MTYPTKKQYSPLFCCTHEEICPFAVPQSEWQEISNDPTEAYYHCNLLGIEAWGEKPKCLDELSYRDQKILVAAFQLELKESHEMPLKLLSELQKTIENLTNDNRDLLNRAASSEEKTRRLQSDYDSYKKHAEQEHRSLKAEIITSLRAINLCLLASITTVSQALTHRQRNFRMRHVNQIISNEIDRFADRKLVAYEDDF